MVLLSGGFGFIYGRTARPVVTGKFVLWPQSTECTATKIPNYPVMRLLPVVLALQVLA